MESHTQQSNTEQTRGGGGSTNEVRKVRSTLPNLILKVTQLREHVQQ